MTRSLPPDLHIHTALCGHAVGEAEEYVRAALRVGIRAMGFAEHVPQYWRPPARRDPTAAMPESSFGPYVETVLALRARYPEIPILLGVEADYVPGFERELERLLAPYPWDYVYGSVHEIDGWAFDNPAFASGFAGRDLDELYDRYFELAIAAARSGLFDILGHLDVIKKWGHRPRTDPATLYARVARELAGTGVAVEVNTAGLRKPVREVYPAPTLLRLLVAEGVELALGSDAHAPGEVGASFTEALAALDDAGATSLVRFERRQRTMEPASASACEDGAVPGDQALGSRDRRRYSGSRKD